MTTAAVLIALYAVAFIAHCRVTRSLHRRDEQIESMMQQDLFSASTMRLHQTGTSL